MQFTTYTLVAGLLLSGATSASAQQGETVRIAMIEGLSGPFANIGNNELKTYQYVASQLNAKENPAGVTFEIEGMDSKGSPQEAITLMRAAADKGFRYIAQGNGSNVAIPLADAVGKFNERNPGKEIVYFNFAANDPASTNDKCNYWHFRIDADTTMRMKVMTEFMKDRPEIKQVYLINQNYSHGQQSAKFFKDGIAQTRPDLKIAGEDLVPLGQVKDFAPYVAKIKQSGADTIVTSNWGQDLSLFIKALNDAGMTLPIYTFYGAISGTPTVLAGSGDKLQFYNISYMHSNMPGRMKELIDGFQQKFGEDFYVQAIYNNLVMLSHAMAKAKSTDSVKVAAALEGIQFDGTNPNNEMRKSDHQLQQGYWISKWDKVSAKYPYDAERTGHTFVPIKYLEPAVISTPTTCEMKRPA